MRESTYDAYYYSDRDAAALLSRWRGKPPAISARRTDLRRIPQQTLPRLVIWWAPMQAQVSIGVSGGMFELFRDLGKPDDRLRVMCNGVDLQSFQPQPRLASREVLGLLGGFRRQSMDDLIERRGRHLLLQVMPAILKHHPQPRLMCHGDLRGELQQLARELRIEPHVTFVGAIAQADLRHWCSATDLFVLSSIRKGCANVPSQAIACGAPVFATAICGAPKVIASPDVGVLVQERSARGLAQLARGVRQRPPAREALGVYAECCGWLATSEFALKLFSRFVQP